jgi:hypothetical protein
MKMNVKNPFKKQERIKKNVQEKNINETVVKISVKRPVGEGFPVTIAEFEAIQERDSSNNLILVNEDNNFKEDVDVVQEQFMSDLANTLDLHRCDNEEKITKLRSLIEKQEKLLNSISEGYIKKEIVNDKKEKEIVKVKVNEIDERLKLKRYQVFLEDLEHGGEGSYEELTIDGYRHYSYLYKSGILYPYKILKSKAHYYADVTSKRKIYKTEQDLIDQEYMNDNKGFLSGWKQYLWIALIALLIVANVYGSVKLYQAYANFDESTMVRLMDQAEGSAIKCAYYYATIGEETATFINAVNSLNLSSPSGPRPVNIG